MITFTETAMKKISELLDHEPQKGLALRMAIRGRGPGGFVYKLGFVRLDDRQDEDAVIETGGFQVFIDADSASKLENARVDFVEALEGTGFKIDNPNSLWSDATASAVQQVIDAEINPAVAMHGGHVTLLDVREGIAYIQLGGGCQGCGQADVTLKQGIVVKIRGAVPEIREVIDTTEHAAGKNPYFQQSKGCGSHG